MELQPDYGFTICQKAETSSHIFIIVVAEKKRFSKQRTIDKEQGTIKELFSTLNTVTRLKNAQFLQQQLFSFYFIILKWWLKIF